MGSNKACDLEWRSKLVEIQVLLLELLSQVFEKVSNVKKWRSLPLKSSFV